MRKNSRIAALLLIAIMIILAVAGCSGGSPTSGSMDSTAASSTLDFNTDVQIAAEPADVSILVPGFDGKDATSVYARAVKKFEEKYNKKVTIMQAAGEQLWNEKVAAQIASKQPIDVFAITVSLYLDMYQKNYLTPVNDYVDLSRPGNHIDVMDDFVKFDGKYYAAGVSSTPYVLYYNKDMMAANGFDENEPLNRYKAGTWTWESFVEIARTCQDDEAGIFGLENMFDEVFQATNVSSAVIIGDDGKYKLDINSAQMRHTLEMVQDVFNKNKVCGNGYVTGQNKFLKGKAAMHGAYSYEEAVFTKLKGEGLVKFEFGVAPFPIGPDNTDKKNFGHSSGFSISIGSKAPYSAGKLIDMILEESQIDAAVTDTKLMLGSRELYDTLAQNLYIPSYTDGILDKGFGAFYLLYDVRNGEDINQKLAQYETTYTKMVNDANALLD
ncbi:MAG: ABC transporter substrate-binding protein [Saccharofermentanales bacterium]